MNSPEQQLRQLSPHTHQSGHCEAVAIDPGSAEGLECAKCRAVLKKGDGYYCMRLGMDDEPSYVEAGSQLVETVHELYFCTGCEPAARLSFEGFLRELWNLRESDDPVLGAELGTEFPGHDSPTPYDSGTEEPPTLPGLAPKDTSQ